MMAIEGWDCKDIDDLAVLDQESLGEGTKRDFSFYYIDISSVSEGKLRLPSTKTIFRDAPSRARKIVRRSDVLMSMVRPNLKAFAYFDHTDDDCIASTGFAVLTARDQVDARFILYSILSDGVTAQIEALVVGSNYPAINSNAVRGLRVLVPPYSEQTKIAEILSTVDQAIEQTEALIAKQQRIKIGLMQDLLTRGIDEHGNLRSEQTHEFKDSPLGRIPVEWEVKKIIEVSTKVTDGDHHTPQRSVGGFYLLSARNVNDGYIDLSDVDYVPTSEYERMLRRCNPETGDILVSCSGTIGRVCEVPVWLKCVLVRSAALIKFNREAIISRFAEWTMRSSIVQFQILAAQRQAAQPNLFQGEIENLQLSKPQIEEQQRIADFLDSSEAYINRCQTTLRKLRSLKTALMQDLLTGKKRVTALLNDTEKITS